MRKREPSGEVHLTLTASVHIVLWKMSCTFACTCLQNIGVTTVNSSSRERRVTTVKAQNYEQCE